MQLALRFWTKVLMWTGILFVILMAVSLIGGQSVGTVIGHLPVWGGFALVLAAFPAGLAVSEDAIPDGRPSVRPVVPVILAAASVSPSGETAKKFVAVPFPQSVDSPVPRSQRSIRPSLPEETSFLPVGKKATWIDLIPPWSAARTCFNFCF